MSSHQSTVRPTALITGGGTGIGRAAAKKYLAEGYRVVVTGRRLEKLTEVASGSDQTLALVCDVSQASSVLAFTKKLREFPDFFDALSVIVNNAGIVEWRSFETTPDEIWQQIFETNLLGAVRLTRTLLPQIKKNHGVIINVSSNLAIKPIPMTSAYSALKAALVNWTQELALELGASKVRVNCVCPGIVDTPIHPFHEANEETKSPVHANHPLGRMGTPEDIAHAIYALSGPGSEWLTGAVLTVDGGLSLKSP